MTKLLICYIVLFTVVSSLDTDKVGEADRQLLPENERHPLRENQFQIQGVVTIDRADGIPLEGLEATDNLDLENTRSKRDSYQHQQYETTATGRRVRKSQPTKRQDYGGYQPQESYAPQPAPKPVAPAAVGLALRPRPTGVGQPRPRHRGQKVAPAAPRPAPSPSSAPVSGDSAYGDVPPPPPPAPKPKEDPKLHSPFLGIDLSNGKFKRALNDLYGRQRTRRNFFRFEHYEPQLPAQPRTQATRYYYPPRFPLPLSKCFHNPTGYVCCNEELNDLMVETFTDLEARPKFHTCNIQKLANEIQDRAQKHFNASFETIAGFEDFAQTIHFNGDLVCKVELGGRYMLAYGTVFNVQEGQLPPIEGETQQGPADQHHVSRRHTVRMYPKLIPIRNKRNVQTTKLL